MRNKILLNVIILLLLVFNDRNFVKSDYNGFIIALKGVCYLDLNQNKLFDDGEPGFAGVAIDLANNSTDYTGAGIAPMVTKSDGVFVFDKLMESTIYEIRFKNPAGYLFEDHEKVLSCPEGKVCVRDSVAADHLVADKVIENTLAYNVPLIKADGAIQGTSIQVIKITVTFPHPTQPPTIAPTLPPTQPPTRPPVYEKGSAVVGNFYVDANGDGSQNSNEGYASGIAITLLNNNDKTRAIDAYGKQVPTATTDSLGKYIFDNLAPGVYCIWVESKSMLNPGCVGQIVVSVDGNGVSSGENSNASDGVRAAKIIRLGTYGAFPSGDSSVSGVVFSDKNLNNVYDSSDVGIPYLKVKIFLPVYNLFYQMTSTDSGGKWSINGLPSGFPFRVEYVLPDEFTSTGSTPVKFVVGGNNNLKLGLAYKNVTGDGSGLNFPRAFATSCFVKGPYNGANRAEPTLVSFTKDAIGKGYQSPGNSYMTKLATHKDIGSVHGVAYDPFTDTIFASAYHKTNSDFGPEGSCAIYKINKGQISTFVNLNNIFGNNNYCGGYHHTFDFREISVASSYVGKVSFGQLMIVKRFIYVTNLARNEILQIPLNNPTKDNIVTFAVPNPGCLSDSDWHIFPVMEYQGQLFTGGVCSGENGSKLSTYILKYNDKKKVFSTVLFFTMNYARGCRYLDTFANCISSQWVSWNTKSDNPQPMLSSIYFDDNGHIILNFKDRSGDISSTVSAPDMLVACLGGDGLYYLEKGGVCGGVVGAGTKQKSLAGVPYGPGGGQFFDLRNPGLHDYTASFGSTKAGPNMIVSTGFDYYDAFEGSIRWFNTSTGKTTKGYSLYISNQRSATFGKQNGLGDITGIYDPTISQFVVGRIWNDANKNGIQDANENGIGGISMFLISASNQNPINQIVSDKNGYFYFSVQLNQNYHCACKISDLPTGSGLSPVLTDNSNAYINSNAQKYQDIYIDSFKSESYGGFYFNHCHFGITYA
ncbi:hypothetical protein CYY_008283 [Polysphondylium violaceum]|uniref:SD-repeat containing protein B domain-containing protein n=1 Tax=Polysphondylium violaceum TaxID=133409 RepID=A0A8J4V1E1_9MYCE|nr:hypothetical protein CYY_008283 [Polysphondylium violaceum]